MIEQRAKKRVTYWFEIHASILILNTKFTKIRVTQNYALNTVRIFLLDNQEQELYKLVTDDTCISWVHALCSLHYQICLLYTSPSPRDLSTSRMPSSAWKKNHIMCLILGYRAFWLVKSLRQIKGDSSRILMYFLLPNYVSEDE